MDEPAVKKPEVSSIFPQKDAFITCNGKPCFFFDMFFQPFCTDLHVNCFEVEESVREHLQFIWSLGMPMFSNSWSFERITARRNRGRGQGRKTPFGASKKGK